MNDVSLKSLKIGAGADARDIAVRLREGKGPGLFWLGGFKSDMKGTKAKRWIHGRQSKAAPARASIIPGTGNPAAISRTAR